MNATGVMVYHEDIHIQPGPAVGMLTLLPGQEYAPGDQANMGRTGTPTNWLAGAPMPVEVFSVDKYWNLNRTINSAFTLTFSNTTISDKVISCEWLENLIQHFGL